jgi:hypothetical protein
VPLDHLLGYRQHQPGAARAVKKGLDYLLAHLAAHPRPSSINKMRPAEWDI